MILSASLIALFFAGVSQAAPAKPATPPTPPTPPTPSKSVPATSTSVSLVHSTLLSKNVTNVASGQFFNDVSPTVDLNKTVIVPEIWKPIHFFTCESSIDNKATQLAANVGTVTSGFITDANLGTIHKNYEWGAIYCKDPIDGAHAVYGEIWLKFLTTTNYGYPITDETGTTDNNGNVVRFNTFSQGNAIYWTPQYGAHLIYGDIYSRWMSIGNTKSVVGFPITDEASSGTHGGRFNDFSNGMIYWHAGTSYVYVGAIPSTLSFTWSPINLEDTNGWATITFSSNGNARWQSHMHDSVPWPYDWAISFVLMSADGTAVSLAQHGSVGPNLSFLGVNDSDKDQTVNNAEISENWRAWVAMTQWRARADNSWAWLEMLEDLWNDFEKIYPYIAAAVALLA